MSERDEFGPIASESEIAAAFTPPRAPETPLTAEREADFADTHQDQWGYTDPKPGRSQGDPAVAAQWCIDILPDEDEFLCNGAGDAHSIGSLGHGASYVCGEDVVHVARAYLAQRAEVSRLTALLEAREGDTKRIEWIELASRTRPDLDERGIGIFGGPDQEWECDVFSPCGSSICEEADSLRRVLDAAMSRWYADGAGAASRGPAAPQEDAE